MTRVVIDANVLLSSFVSFGTPYRVLEAWHANKYELWLSEYILVEVERTLGEHYFAQRVSVENRARNLQLLRQFANIVVLTQTVAGIATQTKDDPILATALNARADYLVTGDKALLALGNVEGTRIMSATEFLAALEGPPGA